MKWNIFKLLKLYILSIGLAMSGCSTPFGGQKEHGPSPEDTLIKTDLSSSRFTYTAPERVLSTPRRPDPEPEEVLIEEVAPEVPQGAEYIVQKGDCLFWIAKKFRIALRDLLNANGLNQDARLSVGQKLVIPGISQEQVDRIAAQTSEYIVKKGDCLSEIAQRYHISVREIKAANGLRNDCIVAGKKLTIPERGRYSNSKIDDSMTTQKTEPFEVDSDGYYTVQRGDSLSKIAQKAKVTVRDLEDWNDISDPKKIQIGKKIRVQKAAVKEEIPEALPAMPAELPTIAPVTNLKSASYGFANDADFFDSVDDIPVVQIQN